MSEPEHRDDPDHDDSSPGGGASGDGPTAPAAAAGPTRSGRSFGDRLIIVLVTVVVLAVAVALAAALLPDWWARRVGDVADGSRVAGVFSGLTCGVVFTALPLLLLRPVVARRGGWRRRATFLALAVVVAAPNLTTLGITLGGDATRPARLTTDVDAPGFRGAVLVGAVAGLLGVVVAWAVLARSRRRSHEVKRLRGEVQRLEGERRPSDDRRPSDERGPSDDRRPSGERQPEARSGDTQEKSTDH